MPARLAIVDDEPHLREAVADFLRGYGFEVIEAADAAAFRALVAEAPVDVALLDIAMPGEDGLSLARWLRRRSRTGIIFATAAGLPIDRIVGLEIGADDYVVKPYDLRELLARIRSLLRRLAAEPAPAAAAPSAPPANPASRTIQFGPYVLDRDGRRLTDRDGRTIDLTPKEFDLLEILASRANRVLSRAQLVELGADEAEAGESDRRIDIRVTRLRRKIEPQPDRPRFIRTVRGEGYVFVPDAD